ncbi:hypothetical protein [Altererythrobacter sp. Root672]|uniref:hypothetical protein n=1 Tax=Altererythrobacter sp. Root672 TaxID=1736584 RepID=UPI0006F5CB5A|nr:hypothetical protein [Altererythrobacter sp. Root672]KRA83730.1 hypothetical protein ASD76_06840 [Altererythrobacter sp. Root672]
MRTAFIGAALLTLSAPAFAEADLTGFWNLSFEAGDPPADLVAKLPPDTVIIADTGVVEFPEGEYGGLKLKPEALAKANAWKPADEMTLSRVCLAPSIVYAIQGPFPFEVFQTPELIVFKYEYFDQVRLVHMDGRGHPPADAPHSKMGHSIGHWEGDELVVDTTHLAPSTITNNGLDHSADIHMVERYRLSPDGKRLIATQWFEDPAVLDNNGARYIQWAKQPGQYVYPYECDPAFALEYQEAGKAGE